MASNANKDVPSEKKTGGSPAISETSSRSAVRDSPRKEVDSSSPELGFPPNPSDFSAMSGLLKDLSNKELAENIAKDLPATYHQTPAINFADMLTGVANRLQSDEEERRWD